MHVAQGPWVHRDFFSYHKFRQPNAIHKLIERRPERSEFLTKRTEEEFMTTAPFPQIVFRDVTLIYAK